MLPSLRPLLPSRSAHPRVARSLLLALSGVAALGLAGCGCGDEPDPIVTPLPDDPTPAPQYNRGFYVDMVIDGQNRLWLAYQDREVTALSIAQGSGDPVSFSHSRVDGEARMENGLPVGDFDGGYYAAIAVDDAGMPHACHWNRTADGLRCGSFDGSAWSFVVVDDGGVGQFASMAIVDGRPAVAYYDYEERRLKFARKGDAGWQDEVVDEGAVDADGTAAGATEADVGKYPHLYAEGGDVFIAYYDVANGDLKVAQGGWGSWSSSTWAGSGAGDVGAWPHMSRHGGVTYLSFEDVTNKDLLWGTLSGNTLGTEIVDGGDFVGPDSAIAWVGDEPVVVYHDGVQNDAKLARKSGGAWTLSTVLADGAVGFHNNLAVDASGGVHWVSFNHTTTDVVHQRLGL